MLKQLITLISLVCLLSAPKAFGSGYNSIPTLDTTIDGSKGQTLLEIQTQLQGDLGFSDDYAKNVRALNAALIDGRRNYVSVVRNIHIINMQALVQNMGAEAFHMLIDSISDASIQNPKVHLLLNVEE